MVKKILFTILILSLPAVSFGAVYLGGSSYLTSPYDPGTSPMTILGWFWDTGGTVGTREVVTIQCGGGCAPFSAKVETGAGGGRNFNFSTANGAGDLCFNPAQTAYGNNDGWHAFFAYDNGTVAAGYYLMSATGTILGSATGTGCARPATTAPPVQIGREADGTKVFIGAVSNIMIFNKILTLKEARSILLKSYPPSAPQMTPSFYAPLTTDTDFRDVAGKRNLTPSGALKWWTKGPVVYPHIF